MQVRELMRSSRTAGAVAIVDATEGSDDVLLLIGISCFHFLFLFFFLVDLLPPLSLSASTLARSC